MKEEMTMRKEKITEKTQEKMREGMREDKKFQGKNMSSVMIEEMREKNILVTEENRSVMTVDKENMINLRKDHQHLNQKSINIMINGNIEGNRSMVETNIKMIMYVGMTMIGEMRNLFM